MCNPAAIKAADVLHARSKGTYFFSFLHIILLWPHFGFYMLFDLSVLSFALRELSNYSLSKGRLLYSFIFVHISYIFIFRSQAIFISEESSETILLFVDSGGSEVGHVPLDVSGTLGPIERRCRVTV